MGSKPDEMKSGPVDFMRIYKASSGPCARHGSANFLKPSDKSFLAEKMRSCRHVEYCKKCDWEVLTGKKNDNNRKV